MIPSRYLIPIILFIASYFIFAYNLEGQPWSGDEVYSLASGAVYFNLLKDGDLGNPCWNDVQHCKLLAVTGYTSSYGPVRNIFVGLGKTIMTGNDKGDFYDWSCVWVPSCFSAKTIPPHDELVAGRFFSPIFGSLSVVIAYGIGRLLFNKLTGLLFSLTLLFEPLWLWNSRVIMTEVYLGFFILLTTFLLLYSLKGTKLKKKYFIAGAIAFGLTINTKETAIYIIIPIVAIILLKVPSAIKLISLKDKHHLKKSILLSALFILVSTVAIVATNPAYYKDVTYPLESMKHDANSVGFLSFPSSNNDNIFRVFSTLHSTIMPYFFSYYDSPSKDYPYLSLSWDNPGTYSTVPISLFFIVGLFYILNKRSSEDTSSKIFLIVWLGMSLIFTILVVREYRMERYFLPLLLPMMLISSYGLARFVGSFDKKIQIGFVSLAVLNNIIAVFVFWKLIYFSPTFYWTNPLTQITMQSSFEYSITIISALTFIAAFLIMICYKIIKKENAGQITSNKL